MGRGLPEVVGADDVKVPTPATSMSNRTWCNGKLDNSSYSAKSPPRQGRPLIWSVYRGTNIHGFFMTLCQKFTRVSHPSTILNHDGRKKTMFS